MKPDKFNYTNFDKKELEDLFLSSKSGDSAAFEKLSGYVRHISYTYFQSKLRKGKIINEEDIDDLSNNVYLSFAEQYHKVDNLEFWLRRVLYLSYINFYKKSHTYKTFELEEARYLENTDSDPGSQLDAQIIVSILDTLSIDKQQVLKLRFWEDLKFSEIAERLGKTEDAVKKMFYRTIEEIKQKI